MGWLGKMGYWSALEEKICGSGSAQPPTTLRGMWWEESIIHVGKVKPGKWNVYIW